MAHSHHDHSHEHVRRLSSLNRAFIAGILLNSVFVAAEFTAGILSNSMGLLSDAGHNLSDVASLLLALLAFRLAQVRPTSRYTYGYRRSTILVSLLNAVILLVAVGAIVWVGVSTFLFAKHLWVIMIIYLIIGVCQAPTWINGNQLMLHLVPPSRLTEGMAWMGAMNSIGSSAGSAIAGQFIDRMGSHGGFMVVTTLALVSLVIALIGFKQIKGSTEQPTLTEVSV